MTALRDPPYLRFCRPCNTIHLYEMPFRLATLRAGLELEDGTSPPVLRRIPNFEPAAKTSKRYDVVRAYLRLLWPATPKHVAGYLDAPVKDVTARWPVDVVEVSVEGEPRSVLSADAGALTSERVRTTRLLGPFDLFLQARDRQLLVSDASRARLYGLYSAAPAQSSSMARSAAWGVHASRARSSGQHRTVGQALGLGPAAIAAQAERLAAYRHVVLSGINING